MDAVQDGAEMAVLVFSPDYLNVYVRGTHACRASSVTMGGVPNFGVSIAGRPGRRRQFGDPTDWKVI
jgi:hypothetical protein